MANSRTLPDIATSPLLQLIPALVVCLQLDYDLEQLELSSAFISGQPPAGQEPLAQLAALRVLAANIPALVRHAAHSILTELASLRELHIDMVGNLTGTCISSSGGLPKLPYMTQLVMTIAPRVSTGAVSSVTVPTWVVQQPAKQTCAKFKRPCIIVSKYLALQGRVVPSQHQHNASNPMLALCAAAMTVLPPVPVHPAGQP